MLASGAHVSLGGVEYLVDESVENHYIYHGQSVQLPGETTDEPGSVSPRRNTLLWHVTDWVGGEGNRRFYPDEDDVYWYGLGLNGRIRGQLQGRPTRASTTTTPTDGKKRCYLANAIGVTWLAGSRQLWFSSDHGASFTAITTIGTGTLDVRAIAGDADAIYVAAGDGTNRMVVKHTSAAAGSTATTVISSHAAAAPWIGAALMEGRLYLWTGRKLFECDVGETLPLTLNSTYRKVYDTQADLTYSNFDSSATTGWWSGCVAADQSIIMMSGSGGVTRVHEFRAGAGRPIWDLVEGFTGRAVTVANNIVYVAGHFLSETGTQAEGGALYALPLTTRQPLFLKHFRRGTGTAFHLNCMAPSYGAQVLIGGHDSGDVFVYDAEFNALSLLDDVVFGGNKGAGAVLTSGPKRLLAQYEPDETTSTTYTIYNWADDENRSTEAVASPVILTQGMYDFGQPHVTKALLGFHVTYAVEGSTTSGLATNQRIIIRYGLDEAPDTTLGAIVSTTTPSSGVLGRHFVQVSDASSTKKFFNLSFDIQMDNNNQSGTKLPLVYAVTPEAMPLENRETWELVVRTKDEQDRGGYTRLSHRQDRADVLRGNLRTLFSNRAIFTFLDGYRYPEKSGTASSTHTVYIEEMQDAIARGAEGSVYLRVVAVPT